MYVTLAMLLLAAQDFTVSPGFTVTPAAVCPCKPCHCGGDCACVGGLCSCSGCGLAEEGPAPYRWHPGVRAWELSLWQGDHQVGGYCRRRGVYLPYDAATNTWGAPTKSPVELPGVRRAAPSSTPSPAARQTFLAPAPSGRSC